jgi:cytochrome c551/c552
MKMSRLRVVALLVLLSGSVMAKDPDKPAAPLDVELEDLRPGLLAVYRSLADDDATLTRIDAKPAFTLGHSSPHPRIPPGPFAVDWSGVLFLKETAPIAFDAYVSGEVRLEVDGVTVLQGRGEGDTAHLGPKEPLQRPPGFYRLKLRYRSLPDLPARLQIWWQGPGFAREPLPPWQLKHLAADLPPAVAREQAADQGRIAVGRLGCARCHSSAFPGVAEPPPGPSLAGLGRRMTRAWLLDWLEEPAKVRKEARMPALFAPDRRGWVERWIVAEHLLGADAGPSPLPSFSQGGRPGDHRLGRQAFVSIGCTACHHVPDIDRTEQLEADRFFLSGLADRLPADELAAFLANPHGRYPDGRMPRLPVPPDMARDIAAYLLEWSKPTPAKLTPKVPTPEEVNTVARRLGVHGLAATAAALIREKGCAQCHPGLGQGIPTDIRLAAADDSKGCLSGRGLPRFTVDVETRKAIAAYRAVALREKYPSPFASRQRLLERSGCVHCHQRDSDRPPPLETISSTLGGSGMESLPFQRTPRLTYLHQKYTGSHLLTAIREGVSGLRPARYSFRMPAFGHDAEALVQALAEGDGELPAGREPAPREPADPTLASLTGPSLVGFQGYACVACHLWNGRQFSEPDPGAVGTELTRVAGRIRRDWFDRFLEDPARSHPGTPMPTIFLKGKPATLGSVLGGDPAKQKDALWSYFALGKDAPNPKPPPPLPVIGPSAGEPPLVAQIPVRVPGDGAVESICVLYGSHDLIVYDVGAGTLHSGYTGAQILRDIQGRLRTFTVSGILIGKGFRAEPALRLIGAGKPEVPARTLHGYDRLTEGVRVRWRAEFASGAIEVAETLRLAADGKKRRLLRELRFTGVPAGHSLELRSRVPESLAVEVAAITGEASSATAEGLLRVSLVPDSGRTAAATIRFELPPPGSPPAVEQVARSEPSKIEGSLIRPGYRAIAYPRPKTASGEDLIQPAAVAVNPRDGRVFVASLKMGEIFVLRDPTDDGKAARFDNYAHGLFQEALSMHAEPDALYVLHRRNLTRIVETRGDGVADRFDRVAALPHGIADDYDYGYGLVRDKTGGFVMTYAPYAHSHLPGSGGAIRLLPGKPPEEIAYGFRNPLGWCLGPEGQVFFTDNQGEWVATNKLCHLVQGRYYGFPNQAQPQHTSKPRGKTAVWVPYGWARSINGAAYDNTGGKFGPFAGQFFLAELMFGGAIIRADLEKVNGEYQGACFPFWGQGLLGPLTLAFDPKGRLYVGSITEPGWMAQPDRGALFRIDYTGQVPFEMRSIHALPHGFRVIFTKPVSTRTAGNPASYQIEYYRYEYTGAYGSPELDRTRLAIERVEVSTDGRSADLITTRLVKDRIYLLTARGVRSASGEALVHPMGAYTMNEVPRGGE